MGSRRPQPLAASAWAGIARRGERSGAERGRNGSGSKRVECERGCRSGAERAMEKRGGFGQAGQGRGNLAGKHERDGSRLRLRGLLAFFRTENPKRLGSSSGSYCI
jgi:hypothetical protein